MQTNLPESIRATPDGVRAEEILRSCVHCGFCNATCPTYQITGDELDGPRGRIYLIKDVLESGRTNPLAMHHLDRCLTCRACETTCPSGVDYGELLEIGRDLMTLDQPRPVTRALVRRGIRFMVPDSKRFRFWLGIGRFFRWLLPRWLSMHMPKKVRAPSQTAEVLQTRARKIILLNGCVQQVATPEVNAQLARFLAKHDIQTIELPSESCCGSLNLHLGHKDEALVNVRANIDAFWPLVDEVEAVISTATGCGVTVKDYERLMAGNAEYEHKAYRLSAITMDVAEYLTSSGIQVQANPAHSFTRVAWHSPCSLQHGQSLTNVVEPLLEGAGYELVAVKDRHLCCGSAGTYSLLQRDLADELRINKVTALSAEQPDVIATANVGCQMHISGESKIPVLHWLELIG